MTVLILVGWAQLFSLCSSVMAGVGRDGAMSDIIFYHNPMSRGQIIRWMLEEVGAPYDTEILDYASSMKDEGYRAINPMMKVPAISHNGKIVTECAAICAYLADVFPEAG